MPTIKVIAVANMSPEAMRIILLHKGYKISVTGEHGAMPTLAEGRRHLILVPDYRQLDALAPQADMIHRVVVIARGHHEAVVQRGIPLLDAIINDGILQYTDLKTAEQYYQAVENDAIDLVLGETAAVTEPTKRVTHTSQPATLAAYLDTVNSQFPDQDAFDRCVATPSCLYCLKALSKDDYRAAVHAAIAAGLDKATAKSLYLWVKQYQAVIYDAAAEALKRAVPTERVAQRHGVPTEDLDLLVAAFRKTSTRPSPG
jgi:hypothetical protein